MANPELIGLIHSLTATGESALGELNALTARMNRDGLERSRRTAERSLRVLEMLAEKTRGNLDRVEADALTGGIRSLREGLDALDATPRAES